MFYAAAGETVTVTDAPARDLRGNPTTTPVPRPVDGVVIQSQTTTTDTTTHGPRPVTTIRALFPEDDPITTGATVAFSGRGSFHVDGVPLLAQSQLTGRCFGLIVDMTQVGAR